MWYPLRNKKIRTYRVFNEKENEKEKRKRKRNPIMF